MRTVPGTVRRCSSISQSAPEEARKRPPAIGVLLLLGLTFALGGCSVGSEGLPSKLPGIGAGGALKFVTNSSPDGIAGRTYTRAVTVIGGIPSYACSLSGTLPPGLIPPSTIPSASATCMISGTITPGTSGSFTFSIQVTDSSAPFQVVTQSFTIFVRPEFAFGALPASFPDGVKGRTYGIAPQMPPSVGTTISPTVGNPPLFSCAVMNGGGLAAAPDAATMTSCVVSSGAGFAAAGAFNATLMATDSPIKDSTGVIVVPGNAVSAPATVALTVQPPLTSSANLAVAPAPDAVNGRTYGAPAKTDLIFTGMGGLAPQSVTVTAGTPPTGIVCTPAGTTLTCNSGGAPVTGTTQMFTTTATDTANSATPAGSANTMVTINVDPTISVTPFNIGNVTESRAITTPLVTAVSGGLQATPICSLSGSPAGLIATGGVGNCTISGTPNPGTAGNYPLLALSANDAGNATTPPQAPAASVNASLLDNPPLVLNGGAAIAFPQSTINQPYTPFDIPFTGGNGATASFVCAITGPNALPAAMSLNPVPVGSNCEISGTPNATFNLPITVQVTDTSSTSTAAGNTSQTGTLTINSGPSITTASPLPAGTKGRAFNFTLTATGGTPFAAPPAYHFSPTGALTGTGTGDCAGLSLSIAGVINGTPTAFTNTPCMIAITATDKTGAMSAATNFTIPINDVLTITSTSPLLPGVIGRSYNFPFVATGGNGALLWSNPGAALGAGTCAGLALNAAGMLSGPSAAAAPGTCIFNVLVTDTATGSTAAGSTPLNNVNLPINDVLKITSTSPLLPGVIGRGYMFTFAATGGIGALTWSNPGAALGAGTCAGLGINAAGMLSGPSTAVAPGTCIFNVQVTDTANANTPAGMTPLNNVNLPINAELVVTTTQAQIPNGLLNITYPQAPTVVTFAATGGAGSPLSWTQAGATGTLCPNPGGTMPTGINIAAATGVLFGKPTVASAATTDFTFGVCVEDGGNANVSGNFILSAGAPSSYVLNVMNTNAYIAAPGTPSVEIIDTTGNTQTTRVAPPIPIPTPGFGTPHDVAISPDGRKAFVTFTGAAGPGPAEGYFVIDTITNSIIAPVLGVNVNVALPAGPNCSSPDDIAVSPDNLRIYIVCSGFGGLANQEVAVFDAATNALIAEIPTSSPANANNSSPAHLDIRADNARVYVTLNGLNQLFIIDNTATPPVALGSGSTFALNATTDQPFGIVLAKNGAKTFAFVSKQNPILPNTVQKIDVVDVTTDPPVNNNQIALTAAQVPVNLTAVPGDARIYFTLSSANQFGVINNTVAPPVLLAGSPFALAAGTNPVDIAIPALTPVPANGVRVYITQSTTGDVAIFDNKAAPPPTANGASPITLTVGASPTRIKAVPVPN